MGNPILPLYNTLKTTLIGGTALTALLSHGTASVYQHNSAPNADYPLVVYRLHYGAQENIYAGDLQNTIWDVSAYAEDSATAQLINNQINNLLDDKTLSVTGYTNIYTRREDHLSNDELLENGDRIYKAGGLYRIRLDNN